VKQDNLIEERCRQYYSEYKSEVDSLKVRLQKMEEGDLTEQMTAKIEEIVSRGQQAQLNQNENSDNHSNKGTPITEQNKENIVSDSIGELRERERRKTNILVYNVPESTSTDVEERKEHDRAELETLIKELDLKKEITLSKPVRLSKSKHPDHVNKPRPLRVSVASEEQRRTILQALKNMEEGRKCKLKQIFMKRDMTPLERKERASKMTNHNRRSHVNQPRVEGKEGE
jgi:hypothetical protein